MCQNRDYGQVKKGMVFWYNCDENIDKYNVPKKVVHDREILDRVFYGLRPWLVVSSDEYSIQSSLVQIVPIHSNPRIRDNPNHVYTKIGNKCEMSVIVCDQVRTVNVLELTDYYCALSDKVIDEVDEKLAVILGISKRKKEDIVTFDMVEGIVLSVVKKLMDSVKNEKLVIDNNIAKHLPIIETENQNEIKNNTQENTNENQNEENEKLRINTKFKGKKHLDHVKIVRGYTEKRHNWTKSEIKMFLQDCEEYSVGVLMKKYGCLDRKSLYQLRYYLSKKYERMGVE